MDIMADDGMLMNFSIDDGIINTQKKFKGGTWKDRLSAKKIALYRQNKPKGSTPATVESQDERTQNPNRVSIAGPRPPKRQRVDSGDFKPSSNRDGAPAASDSATRNPPQTHSREVISSLFSYNPTATSTQEKPAGGEESAEAAKPTNAPLVDGIDTFTTLGLSPTLAAHLLTKLELKAPTAIQKSSISQLLKEECDAFIQAETGSGKTLAYLLPLVQRIMALSEQRKPGTGSDGDSGVHRDSGLFALILAPTRELCKQISVVLDGLLRCAHWIVAGTVIGGEKKKSEKARLRKGLNILVATPGRLADHLDNTKVLDISNVRWLVLDEGDRLMELGFEEELHKIVKKLDEGQKPTRVPGLPKNRTTVLCSATMKMNVQKLGEISLKDAIHIKADLEEAEAEERSKGEDSAFSAPAQLQQSYIVTAAKLRLVTLTALLKRTFARKGSVMKTIVFVSCADSVEFHFEVFSRKISEQKDKDGKTDKQSPADTETTAPSAQGTVAHAPAFSNPTNPVTMYKLHGSLPQHVRTSTLSGFAKNKDASVLICTDVASRGLDLPNVDFVVEYDPAFSSDDHLHRIGRTARLGRNGRALIFLLPGNEEEYVEVLKRGYRDGGGKSLSRTDTDEVLKRGFNSSGVVGASGGKQWEEKATEWQLELERWALENPTYLEMARRAFQSHIRAYATHISGERNMFNIKDLHLGHLAKSFALRDRPGKINVPGLRPGQEGTKKGFKEKRKGAGADNGSQGASGPTDAAKKMRAKMKSQMASGASEFNIA